MTDFVVVQIAGQINVIDPYLRSLLDTDCVSSRGQNLYSKTPLVTETQISARLSQQENRSYTFEIAMLRMMTFDSSRTRSPTPCNTGEDIRYAGLTNEA